VIHLIPPEVLEFLLFVVLAATFFSIVRAIRRRHEFYPLAADVPLPDVTTDIQAVVTVLRCVRDANQGVWLVEFETGGEPHWFCATDYETEAARYRVATGKKVDVCLYALGRLAAVYDVTECGVHDAGLTPVVGFKNDYAVAGRVVGRRADALLAEPVTTYALKIGERGVPQIEIAIEPVTGPQMENGVLARGSARLYGYLAPPEPGGSLTGET
jgi:hypothetical protein